MSNVSEPDRSEFYRGMVHGNESDGFISTLGLVLAGILWRGK